MRPIMESYLIRGKNISAVVHTSPKRQSFWLLPGEMVSKREAKGFAQYRKKSHQLRKSAIRKGLLVDVGDYYLVTETLVFNAVSDATSFVLGSSRSGDVAKCGRKTLIGENIAGVNQ